MWIGIPAGEGHSGRPAGSGPDGGDHPVGGAVFWQIYGPDFGMQWQGLIGKDPGYVASELQRRVLDAFSVDSRINGISEFSHSVEGIP